MSVRVRKYVLFALLFLVPLQGMAAMLHALPCAGHEIEAAASAAHADGDADRGKVDHLSDRAAGAGGDHGKESCCHVFTAVPVRIAVDVRGDPPVFSGRITTLDLSLVLERPQRPPRA